jgi:heavy metal efflux system protein
VADALIQVEKSKLSPDFSFGVSSTSIQGTGADNKVYAASKRFSAVQLGLDIPIFTKAQKAKVNSSKLNRQIVENNYTLSKQEIQSAYQSSIARYNQLLATVKYFENTGLNNALLIINTANRQFASGNINYLEWVQVVNQSITIKNSYIDAIKNLNEAAVQLNYYANK